MRLPFTHDQFFDLFAAYNGALWPAVVALWVASALTCAWLATRRRRRNWAISGLLTLLWTWSALAYHAAFFTQINPTAWVFAALFMVQAALLFWFGVVRQQLSFARRTTWTPIGWMLVIYALVYPLINVVRHSSLSRIPTFGLPCPTTILTGGLLILASSPTRILAIIPVVWAVIGGSAAVLLGVGADYALPVTAVALAWFELQKSESCRSVHAFDVGQSAARCTMLRKTLLVGGILSSVVYAAMLVLVARQWPGYNSASQTISELSAIGAPTRSLWLLPGALYTTLVTAFGWGVWKSAGRIRRLRIAGSLILAYGSLGLLWPFAPMHLRDALAAGGSTLTDTLHIALSSVTVLLMLFAIGVGAAAFGKRFRFYSLATLVVLFAFGALTFLDAPRVVANLPTPWIGIWERINVGVFLLWLVVLAIVLLRREETAASQIASDEASPPHRMRGQVSRGFEPVRDAFAENFARHHELGGACCAYHDGEKAVDLWGGTRNKQTGEPWEQNTMVVVHSATKGLAAMTLAIAHSRGWLDYEERVCTYWPEFAQQGKQRITVRQLLAHQAALFAINEPVDRRIAADFDHLAAVLARQKPAWEPGTRQAYHALTLGFYESELLRRIDPQHRSLGRFFHDEIASPLGLDLYLGLPETIPNSQLASIAPPGRAQMLFGFPFRFALDVMNPRSNIHRALVINPGTAVYMDQRRIYTRDLEVPSGNAVGTARAIARAYSVFATGGRELGLRKETLDLLAAPAIPAAHGFYDECLRGEVRFSLGFMKPSAGLPFGSAASFGSPGAGGAFGFADPTVAVGYAYVTSQMGTTMSGDPRDVALRSALYRAIDDASAASPAAA